MHWQPGAETSQTFISIGFADGRGDDLGHVRFIARRGESAHSGDDDRYLQDAKNHPGQELGTR
jgi:hypothetical protein